MAIGNSIVTRAGPRLFVKSIKWHRRAEGYTVYNFEVEAISGKDADGKHTHSYFVGKAGGGAWVHNGKYPQLGKSLAELEGSGLRSAQNRVSRANIEKLRAIVRAGVVDPSKEPMKLVGDIISNGTHRHIAEILEEKPGFFPRVQLTDPKAIARTTEEDVIPWNMVDVLEYLEGY